MRLITVKNLRDAEWEQVYSYDGIRLSFRIFASEAIPGLTVTHERANNKLRVKSIYTVQTASGPKRTNSPTQATRYYNEEVKRIASQGGRPAPGSPKQARPAQGVDSI